MDIRMIHGVPHMECRYLGGGKVLQLTDAGTDRRFGFRTMNASIYWGKENRVQEIEPQMEKHRMGEFYFAEHERNYTYFFHLEAIEGAADRMECVLYRYLLEEQKMEELLRFTDRPSLYQKDKQLKVFVLNANYILLQFAYRRSTLDNTHEGYYDFEQVLYDLDEKLKYQVTEENISAYGIETIFPLERNLCAVRVGYSQMEGVFSSFTKGDAPVELLGIIPITQMISELILSQSQLSMEVICSVQFYETIYGLSMTGDHLIFSRVFRENEGRELVNYNWKTKEIQRYPYKKSAGEELPGTGCLIQGRPYLVNGDSSHAHLVPLDKRNGEIRFQNRSRLAGIAGNLLCIENMRKKMFTGRQETVYEVYQYPEMKQLLRERGAGLCWLEAPDLNIVYMFVCNEEE